MSCWTAAIISSLLLLPATVGAQIDASGLWFFTSEGSGGSYTGTERWVIDGSAVTVEDPTTGEERGTGTFDPLTGAFAIDFSEYVFTAPPIPAPVPCTPYAIRTGVVDATGSRFDAQYDILFPIVGNCVLFRQTESGSRCGNAVVDAGETCDDGNRTAGDGCDASCRLEPCAAAPRTGCIGSLEPRKTKLHVDHRDVHLGLTWTFRRGDVTPPAALGDPTASDSYALCAWDESGASPNLVLHSEAPGGATCGTEPCWKTKGRSGFAYANDSPWDGVRVLQIQSGAPGKTKAKVRHVGHGFLLDGPIALPLRVQLQSSTGACWEATYDAAGVKKNVVERFIGVGTN